MTTQGLRTRHRPTVAVLAVAVGAFGLLQSLIIPVLAIIEDEFGTDQSTVTWVLTAYLLSAAVATPLIGRIGDAVGKQRMLVVTLTLLAIGSLMAALAPSIGWLIVARVIQGFGGGVLPLSFGIIRDEVPADRAGSAVALIASLAAAAFGVGIVVAGPIVDGLGFHWLFWLPMMVTTLAAVATFAVVPESPVRRSGRISATPAILLSGWLVAFLLAISKGNAWGWSSPLVLGLLMTSAVLAALWAWSERRVAVPLIDLDLMGVRGVWTSNLVAMMIGFGMFASFGFLPQLLQTPVEAGYGFGSTVTESGLILLPSSFFSFLMGFAAARLVRTFSARLVICAGTLASFSAFLAIALFHDHTWQLYVWTSFQGIGSGLVVSSLAGVVLASVPPEQSGVASGMNANIRMIGGSIGSALMAGIITARTGIGGFPVEAGYRDGFLVLSAGMLLAAGAALLIPARPGHRDAQPMQVPETGEVGLHD
jgi:EmrB/QacA subfamily drug resistance transporter